MQIKMCGDIVVYVSLVYVVAVYPRKILLINPPMVGVVNRGIVFYGENPSIVI
jgi:hypothetical protein